MVALFAFARVQYGAVALLLGVFADPEYGPADLPALALEFFVSFFDVSVAALSPAILPPLTSTLSGLPPLGASLSRRAPWC